MGKTDFEHNSTYDHGETISFYHAYLRGERTEKEWAEYLLVLLDKYIRHLIRTDNRLADRKAEYEDLCQAGAEGVLKKFRKYNPEKSRPTTYFVGAIRGAMKETYLENSIVTEYYLKMTRKLEKALLEHGYDGLDNPGLTVEIMGDISGFSLNTINNILRYNNFSFCTLAEITETCSPLDGPEKICCKSELSEEIRMAIKCCSPLEIRLVCNLCSEKPLSLSRMAAFFKDNVELRERYEELRGMPKYLVTTNLLGDITSRALSKIRDRLPDRTELCMAV